MSTTPTTTLYYTAYPFVLLFSLLLTIAAPLVHLAHYVVYGLWWWPLGVLAKFETLYIFFGVATLVGVLAGTGLHFFSGFLIAALRLDAPRPSSSFFLSTELPQQQRQRQRRPKTPAEVREGRRRGGGWDRAENGILRRTGKGIKEEENRDDESVWQERVEGASRRVEDLQEERAAAAVVMAAGGGGKGKKKDSYGDWSGRRQSERDRGKEREGERGRKGVMTSTILEESSSEVGF